MKYVGSPIKLTDFDNMVGIIGSRKPTPQELETAFKAGAMVAKSGRIVVSGLAKGIDIEAHRGALSVGGRTIALLSTTKDEGIYPSQHKDDVKEIIKNGGVLHCYEENNDEPYERFGFTVFQKRLAERSVMNAYMCKSIFVVKHENSIIEGGTRYATWQGIHTYGRDVFRLDNNNKLHRNPKVKEGKVWWETDTDLSAEHLYQAIYEASIIK